MLRRLSVSILTSMLSLAAGCASDRAVISQANQLHAGLKPAVMQDAPLSGYFQEVGQRIIDTAREMDRQHYGSESHRKHDSAWMFSQNVKFHLVNSKTLNAFTTGGEHMYIYNELLQQCKSEDELAAVMAHEFAHVYGRYVHKGMNRQMTVVGAALGMGAAGYAAGGEERGEQYAGIAAGATMLAGQFIGMGYTRRDEAEADQLGFDFYTRAGWDPQKFADFFRTMISQGYDKTPALLSDHPTLASRVAATEKRVRDLPPSAAQWRRPPVADAQRFTQIKARAAELGKNMPTDQTLEKAQQLLAAFPSCVTPEDQADQKAAQQQILQELQQRKASSQKSEVSSQ